MQHENLVSQINEALLDKGFYCRFIPGNDMYEDAIEVRVLGSAWDAPSAGVMIQLKENCYVVNHLPDNFEEVGFESFPTFLEAFDRVKELL